jgi:hypothetical protein
MRILGFFVLLLRDRNRWLYAGSFLYIFTFLWNSGGCLAIIIDRQDSLLEIRPLAPDMSPLDHRQ